ncbi:MAG: AAA family ATPase, partial [Flavobacteriaceae bacterium]|nr:AAA family ATPase [Flavobacteriaceae bacterium]
KYPSNILASSKFDSHLNQITTRINIEMDVETLEDLIHLGKKVGTEFKLEPYIEYNIDLAMIRDLLPEMEDLNAMIGQGEFKKQVVTLILYYSMRLNRKNDDLLHTAIYGEPGIGKTEFAQKLAKIYLKLGVLRNNIFRKVRRSDLIAGFLGQTALKTAEVLNSVRGGVLFIDEAYSIGNSNGKDTQDSYSKECLDLINQSLTEMREGDDKYFILMIAGYKDELKRNFFGMNDGLERRFSIHFTMEPYNAKELVDIFVKKVLESGWGVERDALTEEFIKEHYVNFKYYGGDMELLFVKCKITHSKNLLAGKSKMKRCISETDVKDGFELFMKNSSGVDPMASFMKSMYMLLASAILKFAYKFDSLS